MSIRVMFFAQLESIVGTKEVVVDDIADTDLLKLALQEKYPGMVDQCYLIAVDKDIIQTNTSLTDGCTVALLPPFSGG